MYEISINFFHLSYRLKKKKKSENLLREEKSPNFGTKVDFFPIGKIEIPNFPNTKKFILAELHFKKIKKKIRETFWSAHFYQRFALLSQVGGVAGR